jgi:FixJ family two-component response regulator
VAERLATLTPREREVMVLVVRGLLNKQIAAALGASEKTIKIHRGRVMEKMKVQSVADLVRAADKIGIRPGSTSPPA